MWRKTSTLSGTSTSLRSWRACVLPFSVHPVQGAYVRPVAKSFHSMQAPVCWRLSTNPRPLSCTCLPSILSFFGHFYKQATPLSLATVGPIMAARNKGTVKILRLQRQKGKHRFRRFTLCVVLKTQTTTSGKYFYRLGYYDALKRRLVVNLRMVAFALAKGVQVTKKVYELLLRPHVLIKSSDMSYEEVQPYNHPYMKMALEAKQRKDNNTVKAGGDNNTKPQQQQ